MISKQEWLDSETKRITALIETELKTSAPDEHGYIKVTALTQPLHYHLYEQLQRHLQTLGWHFTVQYSLEDKFKGYYIK
jgi:hypothetical protein